MEEDFKLPKWERMGSELKETKDIEDIKTQIHVLTGTKHVNVFPGAQPVSFESKHLETLKQADYYVCEKSDGIRCLMLIKYNENEDKKNTYLIDRKFSMRVVALRFPFGNSSQGKYHHETLLDGELVLDRIKSGSNPVVYRPRYMVFDCLVMNGKNIMHENLDIRLGEADVKLIKPFESFSEGRSSSPFGVKLKNMIKSYHIKHVFDKIIPSLEHGNDGLIFTPVKYPYQIGTCNKLLKWKPPHLNTIDFVIKTVWDDREMPYFQLLTLDEQLVPFDWLADLDMETFKQWKKTPPNGKIVECAYDSQRLVHGLEKSKIHNRRGGWYFLRFRDDKMTPNHISVVHKILKSMHDNVTREKLEEIANTISTEWKKRHGVANNDNGDDTCRKRRNDQEEETGNSSSSSRRVKS